MRLNNIKKAFLASAALLSAMSMSAAERFVSFKQGDLLINGNDKVEIYMDANDCRGVSYAANMKFFYHIFKFNCIIDARTIA